MADYNCDNEDGNQAIVSIQSMADGDTKFLCGVCMCIVGITLAQQNWPELLATPESETAKPARTRKAKAKPADVEPEFDPGRTIATIVEDQPRDLSEPVPGQVSIDDGTPDLDHDPDTPGMD